MNEQAKHRPENPRQKAAFENYYGQGYNRTYRAVATKFNVSERTVKNWSRIYGWRERIDQADIAQIQYLKMSLKLSAGQTNEQLLKLAQVAKRWTMKCLAGGKKKPTVRQLISLMKSRLAAEDMLNDLTAGRSAQRVDNVIVIGPDKKEGEM